jgi:hypothetical protein
MLTPLLRPERLVVVPRDGHAREENRPLLYRAELAEISAEQDNRDAAEVFRTPAKLAKLFVRRIQCPRAKHADLVDDQQVFLLPVHPDLAVYVQTRGARALETTVRLTGSAPRRIFREPAG